jgi:hypothetical protein
LLINSCGYDNLLYYLCDRVNLFSKCVFNTTLTKYWVRIASTCLSQSNQRVW